MERRDFLKTGLLTAVSLHGFSGNAVCFAGGILQPMHHSGKMDNYFSGVYSGALKNDYIVMPDVFSRQLRKEHFILFVPQKNTSVLLIPEESPEWKALKQLFDAADKEGAPILHERAEIDREGNLYLSESVKKHSGFQSQVISIVGRGYAIEITDQKLPNSRIVS